MEFLNHSYDRETSKKINQTMLQLMTVTVGLSLIVCMVVYFYKNLFPFGTGSVQMVDLYSQYTPLLYRFYDVVTGQKNLFMDFTVYGGGNLYNDTMNELANPVNYFLFLFGRKNIYLAVNVLLIIYILLAGTAAIFFIRQVFPQLLQTKQGRIYTILFALAYSFSRFMLSDFQITKWLLLPAVFPIFLWALLRLLENGKGLLYAILVAYQIILSLQHGYQALVFTLLFSGLWMLFHTSNQAKTSNRIPVKKNLALLGLYTLLGLALSAFSLLPYIMFLLTSTRADANASILEILTKTGLNDIWERIFQICHPVTTALFLFFFLLEFLMQHHTRKHLSDVSQRVSKAHPLKDFWSRHSLAFRFFLLWVLLLFFAVVFQPTNLLLHLGSYMCFPVRYSYMVHLSILLFLTTWGIDLEIFGSQRIVEDKWASLLASKASRQGIANKMLCNHFFSISGSIIAAILALFALMLSMKKEYQTSEAYVSLALSETCPNVAIMLTAIGLLMALSIVASFMVFFLTTWTTPTEGVKNFSYMALTGLPILFACISLITMGIWFFYPKNHAVHLENDQAYRTLGEVSATSLCDTTDQATNPLLRTIEKPIDPINSGFITREPRMSGYLASGNATYKAAIESLGYETIWMRILANGGSLTADRFMGLAEKLSEVPAASNSDYLGGFYTNLDSQVVLNSTATVSQFIEEAMQVDDILQAGNPSIQPIDYVTENPKGSLILRSEQPGWIVLPIGAFDGWHCSINDTTGTLPPFRKQATQRISVENVFHGFIGIPVSAENTNQDIVLSFVSPGFYVGCFITMFAVLLVLLLWFLKKAPMKWLMSLSERAFTLLFYLVLLGLFLVPLCVFFICNIYKVVLRL